MCSVLPTIWLRLSEEALFSKTTTYQKGNHEIGRRRTCARSRRVSRATRSQLWTCWEMVAMMQTSVWLDNQSNRNHPADQLQLILIFSFAANQKLMFQTGDAGCLCFKSFTLEDAFIWKKVCGIDVHLINSGDHPQHCEVNPWRSHLLRLVIWDCTPSVYVALELPGVHSWTLPAEQHASVQVSKGCLLFPVHNGTDVHENKNIQSNCV